MTYEEELKSVHELRPPVPVKSKPHCLDDKTSDVSCLHILSERCHDFGQGVCISVQESWPLKQQRRDVMD